MQIAVVGCGYVGLTSAACLAEVGHRVVGTDQDVAKIAVLKRGRIPISEPYLEELVQRTGAEGRLSFTSDLEEALDGSSVVFLCVGTPPLENGDPDLTALDRVIAEIAPRARGFKLIVEKSTVPVQTGVQLGHALGAQAPNPESSYEIASNPEFLSEGSAVEDFLYPTRIVFGINGPRGEELLREVYRPILEQSFSSPLQSLRRQISQPQLLVTDINTAELIKHACNSFLATKISFINAVADLCGFYGADVEKVAEGMGSDPRIGPQFLRPGLGFGGFCLPKDLRAFLLMAQKAGYDFGLLREVERINLSRVPLFLENVRRLLGEFAGRQVAVLGGAFKPNTDDIRFAPALEILKVLLSERALVRLYDPQANDKIKIVYPEVQIARDAYEAARGAEVLLIVTEWHEFLELDWARVRRSMSRPLVFDGRNLLNSQEMRRLGFEYVGVGRPCVSRT